MTEESQKDYFQDSQPADQILLLVDPEAHWKPCLAKKGPQGWPNTPSMVTQRRHLKTKTRSQGMMRIYENPPVLRTWIATLDEWFRLGRSYMENLMGWFDGKLNRNDWWFCDTLQTASCCVLSKVVPWSNQMFTFADKSFFGVWKRLVKKQ